MRSFWKSADPLRVGVALGRRQQPEVGGAGSRQTSGGDPRTNPRTCNLRGIYSTWALAEIFEGRMYAKFRSLRHCNSTTILNWYFRYMILGIIGIIGIIVPGLLELFICWFANYFRKSSHFPICGPPGPTDNFASLQCRTLPR